MDSEKLQKANDVFARYGLSQEEAFELFVERTAALRELPFPVRDDMAGSYRTLALALSGNYRELYYVDLGSEHFVKFFAKEGQHLLSETRRGDKFFDYIQDVIAMDVHPLDVPLLSRLLGKDSLIHELERDGRISVLYRSIAGGKTEYHRIRVVQIDQHDLTQIVIGIINEDAQVRREKEWRDRLKNVKTRARIDSLTGTYNKNAFDLERRALNRKIKAGKAQFAVVICDLNNLKDVNDTRGHLSGDHLLRDAAQRLAKVFAPAKVYRIGGDEFALILEGAVYQSRMYLLSTMLGDLMRNRSDGHLSFAIGMADYDPENDRNFANVFMRADMAMYENKRKQKNG